MKTTARLRLMDAVERERTEPVRLMRLDPTRRFLSAVELDNLNVSDVVGPDCTFAIATTNFLLMVGSIPR